jgi:hypothetical protein
MDGKPSDCPGFEDLLAEWNKKLAESGLEDIEVIKNDVSYVKSYGNKNRYLKSDPHVRHAQMQFYELLTLKIQETEFQDALEKQILVMFSEGMLQVEIKNKLPQKLSRSAIYKKIYKWLKHWGLK